MKVEEEFIYNTIGEVGLVISASVQAICRKLSVADAKRITRIIFEREPNYFEFYLDKGLLTERFLVSFKILQEGEAFTLKSYNRKADYYKEKSELTSNQLN